MDSAKLLLCVSESLHVEVPPNRVVGSTKFLVEFFDVLPARELGSTTASKITELNDLPCQCMKITTEQDSKQDSIWTSAYYIIKLNIICVENVRQCSVIYIT